MSVFDGVQDGWEGMRILLEELGELETHHAVFGGAPGSRHATCPRGCGRVRMTTETGKTGAGVSHALERLDNLAASRNRRAVHVIGYGWQSDG